MANENRADLEEIGNILDLAEELILQKRKLQTKFSKGFLHLAQCKYIMGPNQVGKGNFKTSMQASSQIFSGDAKEDEIIVERSADPAINSLNWFGILVPAALREAQTEFIDSLKEIIEIQRVQTKIKTRLDKYES